MSNFDKKKNKRRVILTIEFEQDNELIKSYDPIELEGSFLFVLKKALNEDRLIIKETEVKTLDLFFDTIII